MDNRHVAATEFKANCLLLIDEVAQQRRPIIITRRGEPVAKLSELRDARVHGHLPAILA